MLSVGLIEQFLIGYRKTKTNVSNVYQMKDKQTLVRKFETRGVQVWVDENSNNCPLAHRSCKNTAERFDRLPCDT